MKWLHSERLLWVEYSALALLVMAPLLLPGFILTLDMVFTPHPPLPTEVRSSYLFHALLHYLSYLIPADWLQKVLLMAVLVLSGVGAHRLVRSLNLSDKGDAWYWAAYFAGVLYMINPFVYSRFMAGQYAVLLGYALLPFFVRSLLGLMAKPDWRSALITAGWLVGMSIVSIHTLGAAAVIGLAVVVARLWRRRRQHQPIVPAIKWLAAVAGMFVLLSAYWLVPLTLGQGPIASQIQRFTDTDRGAFATVGGDTVGVISNVVRLQGFWAEDRGQFVLPQERVPLWGALGLIFIGLTIAGLVWTWRRKPWVALVFGSSIVIGILLVVGLSGWLGQLPLLAGYREPQKLVMLVALGYAVLAAAGVAALLGRLPRARATMAGALLLLPLIWTPTMLWGFNGQLRAAHYPQDWYAVKAMLEQQETSGKVLFLPWHQYMDFRFAGRIVANPAEAFFGPRIVSSHDPEYGDLGPDPTFALSRTIQIDVLPTAYSAGFVQQLATHDIRYILLAKEFDYQKHEHLRQQSDITAVYDGPDLQLYRLKEDG